MRSNSDASGDTTGDQFLLFVSNLSAANTLFAKLDAVAPPEIATEMSIAVGAWNDQMDAASNIASDPLGALGAVFVTSLVSSDAVAAVDEWSSINCGQPVFGPGITAAGSQPCAWVPPETRTVAFPDVLNADESYEELIDALTIVSQNISGAGGDAALELIEAMDELDPEPMYALEAIGRLGWTSTPATQLVSTIDAAVRDLCGVDGFAEDDLAALAVLGPSPDGADRIAHPRRLFGRCEDPLPVLEFTLLYHCGDALALINLADGDVTNFDGSGQQTAFPKVIDRPIMQVTPLGVFWISHETEPAVGLNPPRYVTSLHSLLFSTLQQSDVELHSTDTQSDNTPTYFFGSNRDRAAVRVGSTVDIYDLSLGKVGSFEFDGFNDAAAAYLTENTFLIGRSPTLMVNLATAGYEPVHGPDANRAGSVPVSACSDRGTVQVYTAGGSAAELVTVVDDAAGARRVGSVDTRNLDPRPEMVVAPGSLLRIQNSAVTGMDSSGTPTWEIPNTVAGDAFVFGGWVIVKNRSDETFVINPADGSEATIATPGFAEGVTASQVDVSYAPGRLTHMSVDWVTGKATLMTNEALWEIPAEVLCPSDYSGFASTG